MLRGLPRRQGPLFGRFFFFLLLLTITRSGRLAEIRLSVCISKLQRTLCVSCSRMNSELYIYHLFIWWNCSFLHNSLWITFPTQSYLVLYSLYTDLLHSLIIWLIVIIITQCEFFSPTLTGEISQKSKW